jgi:hypothetical protein
MLRKRVVLLSLSVFVFKGIKQKSKKKQIPAFDFDVELPARLTCLAGGRALLAWPRPVRTGTRGGGQAANNLILLSNFLTLKTTF